MLEEIVPRQPPGGGSRPVPIGSRFIGVSLQPAIPQRVAPQQSPLPLHQSPTIVAQSRSGEATKCAAQPHCEDAVRPRLHARVSQHTGQFRMSLALVQRLVASRRAHRLRRQWECHLYFARPVTFLSCADMRSTQHPRGRVSGARAGHSSGTTGCKGGSTGAPLPQHPGRPMVADDAGRRGRSRHLD
jgi:hypothetical protein